MYWYPKFTYREKREKIFVLKVGDREKEEEEENVIVVYVSKDDRFGVVVDPPDASHRVCRVPSRFCRARDRGVLFAVGD